MNFPSTAKLGNIIGANVSVLGGWDFVDHETQLTAFAFDSFFGFGYNKANNIVQYPIEQGTFSTYNKQVNPFTLSVTLIKSGLSLPTQKKIFIKKVNEYAEQSKFVDVVTPSGTYLNCTISGVQFQNMPDDGADLIEVKLTISEVRQLPSETVTAVKKPSIGARVLQGMKSMVGL